jgi:hypothetical protein
MKVLPAAPSAAVGAFGDGVKTWSDSESDLELHPSASNKLERAAVAIQTAKVWRWLHMLIIPFAI